MVRDCDDKTVFKSHAKDLFLLFFRQASEHVLIVQVSQRGAFCERKELKGVPFAPEVVKQVPAGSKDTGIIKAKRVFVILQFHKAVLPGIQHHEVKAVHFRKGIGNPAADSPFLLRDAHGVFFRL